MTMRQFCLAVFLTSLLTACSSSGVPTSFRLLAVNREAKGTPNSSGLPLRNGQVILTESPETTSYMFMLLPEHFYPFTHGAIVAVEEGKPVVYEISGGLKTFPLHSKILDNVTGKVNRRDFFEYVSGNLYAEVFDVQEGVDGEKSVEYARKAYKKGIEFDPYFNFNDHGTLFCTEFLELSLQAGGAKPHQLEPLNTQPSLTKGLEWLGVLPNQALPAYYFADPNKLVAALGKFRTRASAYAYFEAKREVYRRFKRSDQRLGYVFDLSDKGQLNVRAPVTDFTLMAAKMFSNEYDLPPTDPRIAFVVRKLAEEMFGPYEETPSKN